MWTRHSELPAGLPEEGEIETVLEHLIGHKDSNNERLSSI